MKDVMWIDGLCDDILNKVALWVKSYNSGIVCATKKYLPKPNQGGTQVVDMPTAKAVDVAWKKNELMYLVEILEAKFPKWPVTHGLRKDLPNWRNGKLQVGGARLLTMALFPENLATIYNLLEEMRSGKSQERKDTEFDISSVL